MSTPTTSAAKTAPEAPQLTIDVDHVLTHAVFDELVLRERALHLRLVSWPCSNLVALGESIASSRTPYRKVEVFRVDGTLVRAYVEGGELTARLASRSREALDVAERTMRTAMPPVAPADDRQEASVSFWTYTPSGPSRVLRRVAVPRWEEIADNYASQTGTQLAELMALEQRIEGGQLVLWHGSPGTGKTHALRALAWEWRSWCEMHYVVDPDILLGQRPDYLVQLLLEDAAVEPYRPIDDGSEVHELSKWRLLILEDSGELLAADAKSQTGQALSRLLNVVDGLIGQGLKVVVLITTNEAVGRLHPAVARAGRCLADVDFELIGRDQASAWLASRGVRHRVDEANSLADLYALANGRQSRPRERLVGFAAA